MKIQNDLEQLNTPILFLIFNRFDLTQRVFNEIKKVKPKQLFVVADGARNEKENELIEKTRGILKQVDWDCEIKTNYSNKNLGCKVRVSSGIDWFFENVEQGIIIEDDCIPSQSFFYFCNELLEKYKYDERIMMISGDNFQFGKNKTPDDYYFSKKFFHIWGWATWRRAWEYYDVDMKKWPEIKSGGLLRKTFQNKNELDVQTGIFDKAFKQKIDTWDYQWSFTCMINNGLSVIPNKNLISNIGFDERGTHTKNRFAKVSNMLKEEINHPIIKHPDILSINKNADDFTFLINNSEKKSILSKVKTKLVGYIKKVSKITDSFLGTSFFSKIHNRQIRFHNNKYMFDKDEYSFIHIPKTGGSTISAVLKNQSDINFINLGAHQPVSICLKPSKENKYLIFIRDPVERVWSYYQMASQMQSNPYHMHTKRGLQFFIKHCWEVRDMMCQYISGEVNKTVTEEILKKAINNLENFFFIGDFENIESDLRRLIKIINGRQSEIPHLQKRNKKKLTSNDRKLILKYNKNDQKLYNWFKTKKL